MEKFGLPPETDVMYKDSTGTEVDADIFSELVEKGELLLNAHVNDGKYLKWYDEAFIQT